MSKRLERLLRRRWWVLLIPALLAGYWLLPISGQVVIVPGNTHPGSWPLIRVRPLAPRSDRPITVQVTDVVPWAHVLLTANGQALYPVEWGESSGGTWTWTWSLAHAQKNMTLAFYHDCHTGCIERGRTWLGSGPASPPTGLIPTKLGVVFAQPERDWHGRSGWDVELTYARLADQEFWGIDDLALRVQQATDRGLHVLVRVDYDQGQSLPPADDETALAEYLAYLRRLARDGRIQGVYGYLMGSGPNSLDSNTLAPDHPVTAEWYARILNGYGEPATRTDNAVQVIRAENPHVRVLVGPVRPWSTDQDGTNRYRIDAPWLNYMHTLVAALDESARKKSAAGISLAAPDGFALHVPGYPDAPELEGRSGAEEPHLDLPRTEWNGAQAGFRVYRDWLAVINAYSTTRGLPAYITSSNTFGAERSVSPAQNYPQGWLAAALEEINGEPQVQALCWFVDDERSGDDRWDSFSLANKPGRLAYAAEEFDRLLKQ